MISSNICCTRGGGGGGGCCITVAFPSSFTRGGGGRGCGRRGTDDRLSIFTCVACCTAVLFKEGILFEAAIIGATIKTIVNINKNCLSQVSIIIINLS